MVDHEQLRHDPVLAALAGKLEARRQDCAPLAGKSTRGRLERMPLVPSRYPKIIHDAAAIEALLVELFLEAHPTSPKEIVLDLDATDDPVHGHQEGRFFHGYGACPPAAQRADRGDCYCYLPLYVFCGRHLLAAKLRRANLDASAGAVAEVDRIVARIRARWPRVKILLLPIAGARRTGSMTSSASPATSAWSARTLPIWPQPSWRAWPRAAPRAALPTFSGARWTAGAGSGASPGSGFAGPRTGSAKAEHLGQGPNPRFVVTSLPASAIDARALYEDLYCARGEVENRIKEQQLDLFADRTSAATLRANQLRLWFASFAYVLLEAVRRIGLRVLNRDRRGALTRATGTRAPVARRPQRVTCSSSRMLLK